MDRRVGRRVRGEAAVGFAQREDQRARPVTEVGLAYGAPRDRRTLRDRHLLQPELEVAVVHHDVEELGDVWLQHEGGDTRSADALRVDDAVRARAAELLLRRLHAGTGDVREPADCDRIIADTIAALGGLDAVCYTAAVSPLRLLLDTTADDWRIVLDTNVVGAALIARAAVPHLAPGSVVAFMSSESVGRPRHGLVAYAASKLALEELIRGYRTEHPELRFVKLTVGATLGTEFGLEFDMELAGQLFPLWIAHGEMRANYMQPPEVAEVVVDHLASALLHPSVDVQEIVIRPPGPLLTDVSSMLAPLDDAQGATSTDA